MKKKKILKASNPFAVAYHGFLAALLISLNGFFLIFVHNPYDYTPNYAFAFVTLPFIIAELVFSFLGMFGESI